MRGSLWHGKCVWRGHGRTVVAGIEEVCMYIGLGTVVLVLLIVLLFMLISGRRA